MGMVWGSKEAQLHPGGRRIKSDFFQDFPGSPVVKTALSYQGAQVPSLVRELRSCMPRGLANNSNNNFFFFQRVTFPFYPWPQPPHLPILTLRDKKGIAGHTP